MASLRLELPTDQLHHGFRLFQAVLTTMSRFPDNICFAPHRDFLEIYQFRKSHMHCSFKFPKKLFTHYEVVVSSAAGGDGDIEPHDFLHASVPARSVVGALIIDRRNAAALNGTMQIFLLDEHQQLERMSTAGASASRRGVFHAGQQGDDDVMDEFDRLAGTADAMKKMGTAFRAKNPAFGAAVAAVPALMRGGGGAPKKPTMMCVQLNQSNGVSKHLNLKLTEATYDRVLWENIARDFTFGIPARALHSVINDLPSSQRLVFHPGGMTANQQKFTIVAADTDSSNATGGGNGDASAAATEAVRRQNNINNNNAAASAATAAAMSKRMSRIAVKPSLFYKTQYTSHENTSEQRVVICSKSVENHAVRRYLSLATALGYNVELYFAKEASQPFCWSFVFPHDSAKSAMPIAGGNGGQVSLSAVLNHNNGGVSAAPTQNNWFQRGAFPQQQGHGAATNNINNGGAGAAAAGGGVLPEGWNPPENKADHMTAELVFVSWTTQSSVVHWPASLIVRPPARVTDHDPLQEDSSRHELQARDLGHFVDEDDDDEADGRAAGRNAPSRRGRAEPQPQPQAQVRQQEGSHSSNRSDNSSNTGGAAGGLLVGQSTLRSSNSSNFGPAGAAAGAGPNANNTSGVRASNHSSRTEILTGSEMGTQFRSNPAMPPADDAAQFQATGNTTNAVYGFGAVGSGGMYAFGPRSNFVSPHAPVTIHNGFGSNADSAGMQPMMAMIPPPLQLQADMMDELNGLLDQVEQHQDQQFLLDDSQCGGGGGAGGDMMMMMGEADELEGNFDYAAY